MSTVIYIFSVVLFQDVHIRKVSKFLHFVTYGKCSKFSNTFLFLFSTIILVIKAGNHKILFRKVNREDPDQNASNLGLLCLSRPFWQATSV